MNATRLGVYCPKLASVPSANPGVEPNLLIQGDNLAVLRTLVPVLSGQIRLIYIDPPFGTGRVFTGPSGLGFADTQTGEDYLGFLKPRLVLLRELLTRDGTLYVHLSARYAAKVQVMLDRLFGRHPWHGHIIWKRAASHPNARGFAGVHDVILFYPRSRRYVFCPQFRPYSETGQAAAFAYREPNGRRFACSDVTGESLKTAGDPAYRYDWNGHDRIWRCRREVMEKWNRDGLLYKTRNGLPRKKRYRDEAKGVPLSDVWNDIPAIHAHSSERVAYPTQKPKKLLERIIRASSQEGDLVLDAFCGSGTTLAVAEELNRRWIGIDCNRAAIALAQQRVIKIRERKRIIP